MAELSSQSGVARETIHFYLREGLLPRPVKGGRTVAFYGPEHLERLRTIRRLREEKYLPLAVIRRLLDSPAAAAEQDLDALADVLHISPDLGGEAEEPAASAEAARVAEARELLGPRSEAASTTAGAAERRVLALVDEVLRLEPAAQGLTLDDLSACAASLTELVDQEAALFFDAAIRSADASGAIAALRSGRGAVARFITAYRDLRLRRIVDELLLAIERARDLVARAATVPLSGEAERRLGVGARRDALRAASRRAGEGAQREAAAALAWHLFACGAADELVRLPQEVREAAGARAAVLVAWGEHETQQSAASLRALEVAAGSAPGFALGDILAGEAALSRALRRRSGAQGGPSAGLLDAAVPALHRLACADPDSDVEPAARAFGWFHRGRLELALPPVLGRRRRGAEALRRALAIVGEEELRAAIEPAGRARIRGNAALALGRAAAADGDQAGAAALLGMAQGVDPKGPLGLAAREAALWAGKLLASGQS